MADDHTTPHITRTTPRLTRRRALGLFGALGLGAVAAACGGSDSSSPSSATTTSAPASGSGGGGGTTATTSGRTGVSCVLTPELTEGPYYIDADLVRRDITEDTAGTPVELAITVLDADTCAPVRDAAVDIWHCDALGNYSGFEAASTGGGSQDDTRYLRGTQVTGADGVATFQTIYPGWYRGRAVHIHTKVHTDGSTRHTGQLFFDDDLNDSVLASAPYGGAPDMVNADDSIFRDAGRASAIVEMTAAGDGYTGTIAVGISQS